MFGRKRKRDRDKHRYYLLPGMGKCNRRKHDYFFRISVIVGLIASAVVAFVLYLANQ